MLRYRLPSDAELPRLPPHVHGLAKVALRTPGDHTILASKPTPDPLCCSRPRLTLNRGAGKTVTGQQLGRYLCAAANTTELQHPPPARQTAAAALLPLANQVLESLGNAPTARSANLLRYGKHTVVSRPGFNLALPKAGANMLDHHMRRQA